MGDHFCLKWNNHQENLTGIMTKLLDEQKFVDVSLVCEQRTFKAHQTVLSACSPYFEQVLEENPHPHPIIILRDVKETEMTALLQYMYRGEVSVRDDELSAFLHTARALKVRGLSENKKEMVSTQSKEDLQSLNAQNETVTPPKRPRPSIRINELEIADKHHSDSQSLSLSPNFSKSSPKASSNTPVPPLNYSENSNEMHYTSTSTPTQSIKQEVESISVPSEESSAISHLANIEPRSDPCHKLGDWNFDYGHTMENRNYQTQKAAATAYNKLLASSTALTPSFTDNGGIDLFDGAKQWQIKYTFEKIEGSGFKCKICGQIKKHVRNHYLKHFPEHHECHLCRRTYTRKDNLNSHLKRDHLHRAKTPPDPYQRFKRLTKRLDDYHGLRCFTPDVYAQLKYPAGLHGSNLQPETVTAPMDLSLRPSSVPIQPQCPPIYDILPSLYNYFQS